MKRLLRHKYPPKWRLVPHSIFLMHIKKVIIQGFGSYARAENPDLFQPGVNAICLAVIITLFVVGVNGSGKSNFFKGMERVLRSVVAIQFVLSPKYMKIDEERMKELFHV